MANIASSDMAGGHHFLPLRTIIPSVVAIV